MRKRDQPDMEDIGDEIGEPAQLGGLPDSTAILSLSNVRKL